MSLKQSITDRLAETFHLSFDILENNQAGLQTFDIKLHKSDESYFVINVSLKAKTRMTITCEPQHYAAEFVKIISASDKQERLIFTQYWDELKQKGKVSLKINDIPLSSQDFIESHQDWSKFYLRYTQAPYFDSEKDDESTVVAKSVVLICGMMLSLVKYEIVGFSEGQKEGSAKIVTSKNYERNPINRELCLLEKGYICAVCGFDFEERYGVLGKEFIHVHHTIPVHMMGENYIVNPSRELFPVCPNCHAMLHRKDPPLTIEELKEIVRK